jgi:hypothetical protein
MNRRQALQTAGLSVATLALSGFPVCAQDKTVG